MKLLIKLTRIKVLILLFTACSSDDSNDKDVQEPTITVNYNEGFPQACAQLEKGNTYTIKAQITDNVELASYGLGIHHNFDQHTHDDQGVQCELDPIKQADNPFVYLENFTLEEGLTFYEINVTISIPNDIDIGDYHCALSVTDKTGWQARTSVDIKIVD